MRWCGTIWGAVVFALLIPACTGNPAAPADTKAATLVVRVTDEDGEPLEGFTVMILPASVLKRTRSNGTVTFEGLPLQVCEIAITGPTTQTRLAMVELDSPGVSEMEFVFIHKISCQVSVQQEEGRPMAGATVITYPPTDQYTTDENGRFEMPNIFMQPYVFSIEYNGVVLTTQVNAIKTEKDAAEPIDLFLVFPSQIPIITIVSPEMGAFLKNGSIHFEGRGVDVEDGALDDTLLTWRSDIDGVFGHGRDLVVDNLSNGFHTITLEGIDSDGAVGSARLMLSLSVYDEASWFPLPHNTQWTYHFSDSRLFNQLDDGSMEIWDINDILVYVDGNARISQLQYTVGVLDNDSPGDFIGASYHYKVADYFHVDPVAVYLDSTVEQLSRLTGDPSFLRIWTVYAPAIPIIPDQYDPGPEDSFEGLSTAQTSWEGIDIMRESIGLEVTCEFGERAGIGTPMGDFETIPLTITINEQVRTWNLARGIGVARMMSSLRGQPTEATISGMYVPPELLDTMPAAGRLPARAASDASDLDDMRRMLPMLRGLVP